MPTEGRPSPGEQVVTIAERPDLAPVVAEWLWHEFWRKDLHPLADAVAEVAGATAPLGPPQCFILLADGDPVGTASFVAQDLDSRPDLTPWLASVFVAPTARGRGYVQSLITAVEEAARGAGYPVLWLFTRTAEGIYARAGWRAVGIETYRDQPVTLMCRSLAQPRASTSSTAPAGTGP